MTHCEYIYCRAPMDDGAEICARCSHPRDRARLTDPKALVAQQIDGLPEALVDMHQILPNFDGVLELQRLAMGHFGIQKVLVQSAPPQATSLWGNEKLRQLAAEDGEHFWVSQFLDPRHPEALGALEKIAAAGLKVIKLLPPAGFRADDPDFDDFFAAMERLGLVVMAHTGFITARHKREEKKAGVFLGSHWANPLYFDTPARKFPDLPIILCHTGGAIWYEEAAQMVTQHHNVWGDVSGFGLFALQRLLALDVTLDWGKVFWGNDSPPFAYPFNLRLVLHALRRAGAEHLAPALLHDNGRRFAGLYLEPGADA
jgi:predicted TIM-barrel fold metal-dependent hydrolase